MHGWMDGTAWFAMTSQFLYWIVILAIALFVAGRLAQRTGNK